MLREVKESDIDFLFALVNESEVRKNSLNQKKIEFKEHKQWFLKKLDDIKNAKSKMFIYEKDKQRIGQIRLDKKGMFFNIDISITEPNRAKGISRTMLFELLKKLKDITILAYIKNSNDASKSLFLSAGFKKVKECKDISFYKVKI